MQVRVVAFFCMQLHVDNGAIILAFQTDIYFPMRTKDKQTYNNTLSKNIFFFVDIHKTRLIHKKFTCGIGRKVHREILICMELTMHGNLDYTKRSLKSNMRVPYWILKRDRESLLKGRKLFENIFGEPVEGRVNLVTSPLI